MKQKQLNKPPPKNKKSYYDKTNPPISNNFKTNLLCFSGCFKK